MTMVVNLLSNNPKSQWIILIMLTKYKHFPLWKFLKKALFKFIEVEIE